jgi:hypothetical protein
MSPEQNAGKNINLQGGNKGFGKMEQSNICEQPYQMTIAFVKKFRAN